MYLGRVHAREETGERSLDADLPTSKGMSLSEPFGVAGRVQA